MTSDQNFGAMIGYLKQEIHETTFIKAISSNTNSRILNYTNMNQCLTLINLLCICSYTYLSEQMVSLCYTIKTTVSKCKGRVCAKRGKILSHSGMS